MSPELHVCSPATWSADVILQLKLPCCVVTVCNDNYVTCAVLCIALLRLITALPLFLLLKSLILLQEFGDHVNIVKLLNIIQAQNDKDIYLVFEYMGMYC